MRRPGMAIDGRCMASPHKKIGTVQVDRLAATKIRCSLAHIDLTRLQKLEGLTSKLDLACLRQKKRILLQSRT